jgi:hypothetical protein
MLGQQLGLEMVEYVLDASTMLLDALCSVCGARRESGEDIVGCVCSHTVAGQLPWLC